MSELGVSRAPDQHVWPRDRVQTALPWTVLHVCEAWNGGVGVYLEALIGQQLEDPRIGQVHLVCSASRSPEKLSFEPHPKLCVRRYESSRRPWEVASVSNAVRRIVERLSPDLVHLHSSFAGLYGRMYPLPCPVVYCAHGWAFTQEVSPVHRLLYAGIEAALARRTAALIHISQDELRRASSYGIRARINRVILHGVRPPTYRGQPALRVDASKINLGFIGRFDRQKGTEFLLGAFQLLERSDIQLYLIGDFDREVARSHGLEVDDPRVTKLGWIPPAEIDSYVKLFDAVIIPSRWEGFGLVAAEAMRNGKPAIVSHRGGLPEQIVHGYNGLVFPLGSTPALVDVLRSLEKGPLAEMGANARRVWERSFSEERAYGELMDIYAELLSARAATTNLDSRSPGAATGEILC